MGADREDPESRPRRAGTDPGLGPSSSRREGAAGSSASDRGLPPPVDFDALNAALGEATDGIGRSNPSEPEIDNDDLIDDGELDSSTQLPRGGDSSGKTNAAYASARPHTIPPTRAPVEDPNAPAVIVASDDTVRSAPPAMTMPLGRPYDPSAYDPSYDVASAPTVRPSAVELPSSGQFRAAAPVGAYPATPQPFPTQPRAANLTVRMPERPINPRRQKTPTIVMRPRGPTAGQKVLAFLGMLVLVTACGIAVIAWRQPGWLRLAKTPRAATSGSAAPVSTLASPGTTSSAMQPQPGPTLTPLGGGAAPTVGTTSTASASPPVTVLAPSTGAAAAAATTGTAAAAAPGTTAPPAGTVAPARPWGPAAPGAPSGAARPKPPKPPSSPPHGSAPRAPSNVF